MGADSYRDAHSSPRRATTPVDISVGPAKGMSGVFVNVNRGKRSVAPRSADPTADKAALRFGLVAAGADVFKPPTPATSDRQVGFQL